MSFFDELKRRNVFRVGIAYAITGWVLLQVVDLVLDHVEAPSWVMHVFMLMVAVGFIVALIVAWAYEVTPEGIKRESEVPRDQSIRHHTAKRLDVITLGAIGLLVLFLLLDRLVLKDEVASEPAPSRPAAAVTGEIPEQPLAGEPAIPDKSIAVLPLANRSVNAEDAFFAEGIHDELLTRLSRIGSLKVISRTSVMGYANTDKRMTEIGQELGVATLLEGGVQRAGNRVRINVQLIEAATDKHLWAEVYDRELTADNLFDIQSEITRNITDELQAVLTGEERAALNDKPTDNVEAYAYYLRAKGQSSGYGRTAEQIHESIATYRNALVLDPKFAEAWAALATDWIELHWISAGLEGEREEAEKALAKARELAPKAPETLVAEGYLHYWGYRDYASALQDFDGALQKKPGSVLALRGKAYVLRRLGRLDESIANFNSAMNLDPNDPQLPADLGYTLIHSGQILDAESMFRRALAQAPDNLWVRWVAALYYQVLDDLDEMQISLGPPETARTYDSLIINAFVARAQADEPYYQEILKVWSTRPDPVHYAEISRGLQHFVNGDLESYRVTLEPLEQPLLEAAERSNDPEDLFTALIQLYGLLGEPEKLERMIQRYETELKPDAMRLVEDPSLPLAWAVIGEREKVLDRAERMVEEFGIWEFCTFVQDPVYNGLRGMPRYKELALQYDRWLETVR